MQDPSITIFKYAACFFAGGSYVAWLSHNNKAAIIAAIGLVVLLLSIKAMQYLDKCIKQQEEEPSEPAND